MKTIRITRDGRLTIPAALRRELRLRRGQRIMAVAYEGMVALVPIRSASAARGFLPGLQTNIDRRTDRV